MLMRPEEKKSEKDAPVIVEFKQYGGKDRFFIGIARSLSPDGISFDSQNYDVPQGEKLECTLKHPGGRVTVPASGVISSKTELWYKCITELKFIGLNERDKGRIRKLLSSVPCRSESPDAGRCPVPSTDQGVPEVLAATAAPEVPVYITERYTPLRPNKIKDATWIVTVCAVIVSAGIYFSADGTRGKDQDSGTALLPADAVDAQADSVPDDILTAPVQDTSPENTQMEMEQPSEAQDEQVIDKDLPATDVAVQLPGPETFQKSDEPVRTSQTDHEGPADPVETRVSISPAPPSSGGDAQKTEAPKATISNKAQPVPDVKNQAISSDVPPPQNKTANHPAENKPQAPPDKQTVVHDEAFDNNANKWDVFNTGMAAALITNGEYYIQNKRKEGAHIILRRSDFPLGRDFSVEVLLRLVESSGKHSYGLVFGAVDAQNYYTFQVSASDSYSVRQYHKGSVKELARGKINNLLPAQNPLNSLKVVRNGGDVSFYVNDVYTNKVPASSLSGNKIGFIVEGQTEIAVDRMRSRIPGF